MMPKLLIAALALPLVGLAGNVALNEAQLARATVWEIPVTGYDPRDILRGNYILFHYDWQVSGDASLCDDGDCTLCMNGAPPDGRSVTMIEDNTACRYSIDTRASALSVARPGRVMTADGAAIPQASSRVTGRYFVSEFTAPALERTLADRPMVMRARLTRGGRLMNEELIPKQETTR